MVDNKSEPAKEKEIKTPPRKKRYYIHPKKSVLAHDNQEAKLTISKK